MKIAIVSPWAITATSIGGTERFTIDLAAGLKRRGHSIQVFTLSGKDSLIAGVEYTSMEMLGNKPASENELVAKFEPLTEQTLEHIGELLEEQTKLVGFDAVILNSLIFVKAWQNMRRVFIIHTNPDELKLDWGPKGLEQIINSVKEMPGLPTHAFVAPSSYYAREYSHLLGTQVLTIPHSIDPTRLKARTKKDRLLKKYDVSSDLVTVLVPGRLEAAQKQPLMVLEACALIPKSTRGRLQIVFSGLDSQYAHEGERLKSFAQGHDIRIGVFNFGDIQEAYSVADVVILPSLFESFGYTALESLSLGKPTILNDIPTYREIAKGALNASFFGNDVKELAEAIEKTVRNHEPKNQPKRWVDRYSNSPWIEKYQSVLDLTA